jgi:hypothetical protein
MANQCPLLALSMRQPQFQGYESEKHRADSAFVAKWGKRLIILWLSLLSLAVVFAFVLFLTIGGCVAAVASAAGKSKGVTTEAEMERDRQAIQRQLNSMPRPILPQMSSAPVAVDSQAVAASEERIHRDVKSSVDRALKRLDDQRRSDYQGFPGKYDADPHPWKRSKQ